MKIAQFVNVMLFALVAGVFWGTWFGVVRSMESMTPETYLETVKAMIQNSAWPMRTLDPAAMLSTLPVLYCLLRRRTAGAFYLTLAGLVFSLVALSITLLVNVPINHQMMQWTPATLPSNWQTLRSDWQFFHAIRTLASLAGLGCVLASTLLSKDVATKSG